MDNTLIPKRLLAIGDIHGFLDKLNSLLDVVQPTADDKLIFLGDYVDRGPNSSGVLDALIALKKEYPQTVFIRGNHEQMFIDALTLKDNKGEEDTELNERASYFGLTPIDLGIIWWREGGEQTLASYGNSFNNIPQSHYDFLKQTQFFHEERLATGQGSEDRESGYLFVHAGADMNCPPQHQHPLELMNRRNFAEPEESSHYTIVHGHTVRLNGPEFLSRRINLDTGVYVRGGKLTCCDVLTRQTWQA